MVHRFVFQRPVRPHYAWAPASTGRRFNMQKSFGTAVLIGGALVALVFLAAAASIPVAAQPRGAGQPQAKTTPAGPIPHTSWDEKPDLTGVWGPATQGESPNQ